MAILIKNPQVEARARELAARTGESLTLAIDEAVKMRLDAEKAKPRPRPTLEEALAATDRFRKAVGLDKVTLNVTRADFDEINEIPGLEDDELDRR
jgi:antitoxin VapB